MGILLEVIRGGYTGGLEWYTATFNHIADKKLKMKIKKEREKDEDKGSVDDKNNDNSNALQSEN